MDFQPMSPEEIERTVQFLLRQQAQFVADFDRLTGKVDRIADALVGLTGIVGRIAENQQNADARIDKLAVHSRELDEQLKLLESHMDVLIQTFERHLREGHGPAPS